MHITILIKDKVKLHNNYKNCIKMDHIKKHNSIHRRITHHHEKKQHLGDAHLKI